MTTDYQTFRSPAAAEYEISTMRGWPDARPEQIHLPDHPDANGDGDVWVIRCDESRYLRTDGQVR